MCLYKYFWGTMKTNATILVDSGQGCKNFKYIATGLYYIQNIVKI